jgi:hypothetical protein
VYNQSDSEIRHIPNNKTNSRQNVDWCITSNEKYFRYIHDRCLQTISNECKNNCTEIYRLSQGNKGKWYGG